MNFKTLIFLVIIVTSCRARTSLPTKLIGYDDKILNQKLIVDDLFFETFDYSRGLNQEEFYLQFKNSNLTAPIWIHYHSDDFQVVYHKIKIIELNNQPDVLVFMVERKNDHIGLKMQEVFLSVIEDNLLSNIVTVGRKSNYAKNQSRKTRVNSILSKKIILTEEDHLLRKVFLEPSYADSIEKIDYSLLKENGIERFYNSLTIDYNNFGLALFPFYNERSNSKSGFLDLIQVTNNEYLLLEILDLENASKVLLMSHFEGNVLVEEYVVGEKKFNSSGQLMSATSTTIAKNKKEVKIDFRDDQGNEEQIIFKRNNLN